LTNKRVDGIIGVSQQVISQQQGDKMASVKVGDFYTTSNSGIKGIVENIYAHNGRKVVELTVQGGETLFSTLPRGIRATATA
jgi:preprotein translocase subunit YajC